VADHGIRAKISGVRRGWDWAGLDLADGGAMMVFPDSDKSGGALWRAAVRGADGRGARSNLTRSASRRRNVALAANGHRVSSGNVRSCRWRARVGAALRHQSRSRASTGTICGKARRARAEAGRRKSRGI
jgi:predicted secreted hydrolase